VRGEGVFVHDLVVPDMLHARVVRPPGYHYRLESLARDRIGADALEAFIVDGRFVAVVARDEYTAVRLMEQTSRAATWRQDALIAVPQRMRDYLAAHEAGA
jgi:hypothetical protein